MNIPTKKQIEDAVNDKVSDQTGDAVREILPVMIQEMNKVLKDKGEDTVSFRESVITSVIVASMIKQTMMLSAANDDDMMNEIADKLMTGEIKV